MAKHEIVARGMTAPPRRDRQVDPGSTRTRGILRHRDNRLQQCRHIHRARVAARQFRIEPGSIRYVRNQAIEPADVMLHDVDQSVAGVVRSNPRQRFKRAAERRQRVLEFVRDVGRETLNRVQTIVQGFRHFPQGA